MARPRDPAKAIRCPKCGSNRPNYRMLEATNHWIEAGKVVEETTGYGVCCQDCGQVYEVYAGGTFIPDELSLPLGRLAHGNRSEPAAGAAPATREPPATMRPTPRRAPRV